MTECRCQLLREIVLELASLVLKKICNVSDHEYLLVRLVDTYPPDLYLQDVISLLHISFFIRLSILKLGKKFRRCPKVALVVRESPSQRV